MDEGNLNRGAALLFQRTGTPMLDLMELENVHELDLRKGGLVYE